MRSSHRRLGIALCLFFAVPSSALATEFDDFEEARQAYLDQRYQEAAGLLERLVGGPVPRLQNATLILESRKYLGAAYLFLEDRDAAAEQFALVLRQDPSYVLDPFSFPAPVVEFFDGVRDEVRNELNQQEQDEARRIAEQRRREAERRMRQAERSRRLEELARVETVELQSSRGLALLPFGVGQFRNGHRQFGVFLAASETILLASTLVSFGIHLNATQQLERFDGGVGPEGFDAQRFRRTERTSRILNQVSFSLLAGITVLGLIDAQVRFRPYRREQRPRELPGDLPAPEPEPELDLEIGVTRLQLRLRF